MNAWNTERERKTGESRNQKEEVKKYTFFQYIEREGESERREKERTDFSRNQASSPRFLSIRSGSSDAAAADVV